LNFFFSRIRLAKPKEIEFLEDAGVSNDYPFVSPCGTEINFIRPAGSPFVFHSMVNQELYYGGNLRQQFDHTRLAVSKTRGRLYHELFAAGNSTTVENTDGLALTSFGLIRSSVAVLLSDNIVSSSIEGDASIEGDELAYLTPEGASPIRWLPEAAEPGQWAQRDEEDFSTDQ
jgi:hypothetical protein